MDNRTNWPTERTWQGITINPDAVKYYRLLSALSRDDLGKRAGVGAYTILLIETGKTRRSQLRTLRRLADALGVEPRQLLQGQFVSENTELRSEPAGENKS